MDRSRSQTTRQDRRSEAVMPKIFLSYRRQESPGVAGRIYDRPAVTSVTMPCSWTWIRYPRLRIFVNISPPRSANAR